MNRRNFLTGLSALVGGIAIEEAIPFNRVWSFPKQIIIAKPKPSVAQVIAMMHEQIKPKRPRLYQTDSDLLHLMPPRQQSFDNPWPPVKWWGETPYSRAQLTIEIAKNSSYIGPFSAPGLSGASSRPASVASI